MEVIVAVMAVVVLLLLLALGVHVAIALALVSIVGLILISGFGVTAAMMANVLYAIAHTYSFVLIPLFILMGGFAAASGIVEKGIDFAHKWLGGLPGGLASTVTLSCGIFAAACGSSSATAAAIGKFVIPEMERHGYDRKLATGVVAASGTLGILIPPSLVLVVYGITVEESIGRLFLAGVLPGVLSAVIYMIGITLIVVRWPHLAPGRVKVSWKERIKAIPSIWGVLLLVGIVMGGIYTGVFTPTEAGGIGAFSAFLLLLLKVRLPNRLWKEVKTAVLSTVQTTVMIFIILITAILFSRFLVLAGVVDVLMDFLLGREVSALAILVGFLFLSSIMGAFMSAMAVLLILAPTAYTVLTSYGFDGIWLGIIMVKLFELAVITPPVGMNVYVVKGIAPHVPIEDIFRGIAMFVVMDAITIVILIAFPQISLWLPSNMY